MSSAVPSRVSLLLPILRLNLVLTYGIPPEFRGGVPIYLFKPPYTIGSAPSLLGHAFAYRWGSLPRVRRHRAIKPHASSERVLPWQVTMDQLIFASLSHIYYWYEVGMMKVPASFLILFVRDHKTAPTSAQTGLCLIEYEVFLRVSSPRSQQQRTDYFFLYTVVNSA